MQAVLAIFLHFAGLRPAAKKQQKSTAVFLTLFSSPTSKEPKKGRLNVDLCLLGAPVDVMFELGVKEKADLAACSICSSVL